MIQASPFDLAPDPEGDKNALTKALEIVKDFALYFVVSEVSRVRPRLMDEIEARLPDKVIQRIHITKETTNLLHTFQEQLQDPLPDVIFVSGFENIISAAAEPRSHPLLLNLNATRNNFYALLPRPVVLWVPPFAMRVIAQAAPDFVSVRSGVYMFALGQKEKIEMSKITSLIGQSQILGLNQSERDDAITTAQSLLFELRAMPASERNIQDEVQVLNRLGLAFLSLENCVDAEPILAEVLSINRANLPEKHPNIAVSLNNLAELYVSQWHYADAEPLHLEALSIRRFSLPALHPHTATSLNNLASLYHSQNRYSEAELFYIESITIRRSGASDSRDLALTLGNLANLYESQGLYDKAEPLFLECLAIMRTILPAGHPHIATSLNNLAELYVSQSRYAEAEALHLEALSIRSNGLPTGHPDIATSKNNLAGLYELQSRYSEAETLYMEALSILKLTLGIDHPQTQLIEKNVNSFLYRKAEKR